MCFSYLFVTQYTHDLQDKIFTLGRLQIRRLFKPLSKVFKLTQTFSIQQNLKMEPRGIFQLQVVARRLVI